MKQKKKGVSKMQQKESDRLEQYEGDTIKIDKGVVCVSDPCLPRDSKVSKILDVKPGKWESMMEWYSDEKRVKELIIYHENFWGEEIKKGSDGNSIFYVGYVGVDSGELGMYGDETGVIAESGYGDGVYDVEALYNKQNEIVSIRVVFIGSDE